MSVLHEEEKLSLKWLLYLHSSQSLKQEPTNTHVDLETLTCRLALRGGAVAACALQCDTSLKNKYL